MKIQTSELKIMNILWEKGDLTAKQISDILSDKVGWNINTTYTLIKRLITKKAIERIEPKFVCHALISQEEIRKEETNDFINRIYDGSASLLFSALLKEHDLSEGQIEELKQYIAERS